MQRLSNISRRDFNRGIVACLAAGVAPSIVSGAVMRGVGARMAAMGGGAMPYDREVEYLENTDNGQYIPLGINTTSGMVFDFSLRGMDDNIFWFGANGTSWEVLIARSTLCFFGNSRVDNITVAPLGQFNHYVFDLTAGAMSLTINDTIVKFSTGTQPDRGQLHLWAVNTGTVLTKYSTKRAYRYFKAWQNGTLVRDFIPVVKDNVAYMFDKVSKQLFANQGTGSFIWGEL